MDLEAPAETTRTRTGLDRHRAAHTGAAAADSPGSAGTGRRKNTMHAKLVLVFLPVTIAFSIGCQPVVTALPVNTPPPLEKPMDKTSGEPVGEVGLRKDLPSGLEWIEVGNTSDPVEFEYDVEGETVQTNIFWEDSDTVTVVTSNHWRQLELTRSTCYKESWALTDGVFAQLWMEDKNHDIQYAMIGFEEEAVFFLVFDDNVLKVAIASAVH
jgi:hypothetical protein